MAKTMKKKIFLLFFILSFQATFLSADIRDLQIEGMHIGDSALDFFSEAQLEDSEQGWHNYNYKEYSTSLLPGKDIYHWLQVSYKSEDENFIIEALAGILEKKNYDNKKCNKDLDVAALNTLKLFQNTKQEKKESYKLTADASREYPFAGKSVVTTISFNFMDDGKIILACYNMDQETKQNDTFRIDVRSHEFVNYLRKN